MELTQLAHNIDELRGFLTDMEGASLDPIKFRRYTIAFLSRAKRLSTSLRHDLSSYAKTQGLNYNELKRAHTWQRHARSNPITDFVYNIRNAFDHESLFLPRVMVTFMPLPNTAPMTGERNLATFTGTFEGLALRAFTIDSSGREVEVPITFLQARYHFREWGFRNDHGDTVPEDQPLTSVPDVLTLCKVYMDCAEQFFKNLQESLSAEFGISKNFLDTSPMAASVPGPHGEFTQKATLTGFEKELTEAAAERAGEARNYFQAAEYDFGARRYRDAAENYQKSIEALPTLSAYLNLGAARYSLSDLRQAEEAIHTGMQMVRQKRNRDLEASFLTNLGGVYRSQGKLNDALHTYEMAQRIFLELHQQIANLLGQANTLSNLGNLYRDLGKQAQALESHQLALELFVTLENLLGQAQTLTNIGLVYVDQGQLDEALRSDQKALELYQQIGHLLSQGQTLTNMGDIYRLQGKLDVGLKCHHAALELFAPIDYPRGQGHAFMGIGNASA